MPIQRTPTKGHYRLWRTKRLPEEVGAFWQLVCVTEDNRVFTYSQRSMSLDEANKSGEFATGYLLHADPGDIREAWLEEIIEGVKTPGPVFQPEAVKTGTLPASQNEVRGTRVEHPQHYNYMQNPELYEVILVLEAWGLDKDFLLGNTVKYVARAGHKGSPGRSVKEAELEDLKKARWYLDRKIQNLEKQP